jgi:hypothetical protein
MADEIGYAYGAMRILISNGYTSLLAVLFLSISASAQLPTLTAEDKSAIQGLVNGYAQALGGCRAEEYADLFAPETGYFASGIRGQVVSAWLPQVPRQRRGPAAQLDRRSPLR